MVDFLIMSRFYVAIIFAAVAELYLRALIIKGIAGIHFYQSALRVLSVEGSLRTAEHIHPTQLIVMEIESRLAHHGDSIEIESDGRTVDAASDASYVNRRRESAAVIRHYEIGNKKGKVSQIRGTHFLHQGTAE